MTNLLDLPRPFFPNAAFAWTSVGLLLAATGIAGYTDTKRAVIPNKLVVTMFAVGMVLNIVRGVWQAAVGHPSWLFGVTDNLWLGGLDGFLFGLSGFLIGFGVFFAVWALSGGKMLGGGDVKLFAALGGWIGLLHLVFAWMISVGVLIVWTIGKVLAGGLRPRQVQSNIKRLQQAGKHARAAAAGVTPKMRITYSVPIAVAVLILSLWSHRVELRLAPPKPVPPPDTTGANPNDPPSPEQPK